MKSILVSLHPWVCEGIASGKETIIGSMSLPKQLPCKAYLCCKNNKDYTLTYNNGKYRCYNEKIYFGKLHEKHTFANSANGKVIGECVCDTVDREVMNVSQVKIYNKPKELSEFRKPCERNCECENPTVCEHLEYDPFCDSGFSCSCSRSCITSPPAMFVYVDEV